MSAGSWDSFLDDVFHGNITPSADTFFGLLLTSSFTFAQGSQSKRSDIDANETTGTGYTAGGQASAITITKDTTNHRNELSFASISWTSSTITARFLAYYKHRGGADTADNLVAQGDFGGSISSTNGTFTANNTGALTYQN